MERKTIKQFTIDEVEAMGIKGFIESSLLTRYVTESIRTPRGSIEVQEALTRAMELNSNLIEQEYYDPESVENSQAVTYTSEADYENSLENLLRLSAITSSLGERYLMRRNEAGLRYSIYIENKKLGELGLPDSSALDRVHYLFGPEKSLEFRHSKESSWWNDETLNVATGRRIETAGLYPDDEDHPHVYDLLRDYKDSGVKVGFIKMTTSKTLAVKSNLTTLDFNMEDPLDIYMMHLEGRSDVFIVQEFIEMRNEYRFMVVDGKIVTGAGCVSEFTPVDRKPVTDLLHGILDTRTRPDRNSDIDSPDHTIVDDPSIVDALYTTGLDILREYEEKNGKPIFDGTLDMAMTQSDTGEFNRPVLVEVNGMSNAGFFANDPHAVTSAIVSRANDGRYDKVEDDLFKESSLIAMAHSRGDGLLQFLRRPETTDFIEDGVLHAKFDEADLGEIEEDEEEFS